VPAARGVAPTRSAYHSIRSVEHSFYDYGGHSLEPLRLSVGGSRRAQASCGSSPVAVTAFHHPAHLGGDLAMLDNEQRPARRQVSAAPSCRREFEVYGVPMSGAASALKKVFHH